MKAIEKETIVLWDGSLQVTDVPFQPGDEVIVSIRKKDKAKKSIKGITASEILASDFVGSWADRADIGDSSEYARILRENAEKRDW